MNKKKQALEALKYNEEYIEEIHHINSNALVAIIEKDVAKLKELKEEIEYLCENWRYYPDSPNKLEYYKAIKYFIKELDDNKIQANTLVDNKLQAKEVK